MVYVAPEAPEQKSLLSKLGKHKMGKSCLYFRQLADLDMAVLEKLVVGSDVNKDAAWYYPEPSEAAKEIKDRIAFWKGVEVVNS